MFSEKDRLMSVSENIMLGQLCPMGTGSFGLLLDDSRLADAIEVQMGTAFDAPDYGFGGMTPGRSPGATPSRMSPSIFNSPTAMSPFHGSMFSPMGGGLGAWSPSPTSPGEGQLHAPMTLVVALRSIPCCIVLCWSSALTCLVCFCSGYSPTSPGKWWSCLVLIKWLSCALACD